MNIFPKKIQNGFSQSLPRLDKLLVEKKMVKSRQLAINLITEGKIIVDGKKITKGSTIVNPASKIEIIGDILKWVSRGGLKLEKAIDTWKINLNNKICMDVGASTGGFSDVLLANNVKKIYAIDVGHNQLVEKLKNDNRIISLEGINAKNIPSNIIAEKMDFICIDLSFISLTYIIPGLLNFLKKDGIIVALIKPQFEVGKNNIGKNGVIKDPKLHEFSITKIRNLIKDSSLTEEGLIESPISGGDGNKEYLIYLKNSL